jgi:hypothetical protein
VGSLLLLAGVLFVLWLLAFGFRREGWQAWKQEQARHATGCVAEILFVVVIILVALFVRARAPDLFENITKDLEGLFR